MEKRNFVTSCRTADSSVSVDELVDSAANAFSKCASSSKPDLFEKKASQEDEKTDSL